MSSRRLAPSVFFRKGAEEACLPIFAVALFTLVKKFRTVNTEFWSEYIQRKQFRFGAHVVASFSPQTENVVLFAFRISPHQTYHFFSEHGGSISVGGAVNRGNNDTIALVRGGVHPCSTRALME